MGVTFFVNVNDIFDITNISSTIKNICSGINNKVSNIIFAKRIEHAFNKDGDGKNFWKNFFWCENYEQQPEQQLSVLIYVFTKQQLVLLQYWWNEIMKEADQKVQDNLTESKEWFLQISPKMKKIGKNIQSIDLLQFYYSDDYIASRKPPKIVRVLFNVSPPFANAIPENAIDFFADNVPIVNADEVAVTDRQKKMRTMVHYGLKHSIENTLKKNLVIRDRENNKLKGGWLFYLGKLYYENEWISYCEKNKHNCQLTKYVL